MRSIGSISTSRSSSSARRAWMGFRAGTTTDSAGIYERPDCLDTYA